MPRRFPPVDLKFPHVLHGGDYNPEQWLRTPEVWDEDVRLMRAAHCNDVSLGIFSWAKLEPAEGQFDFDWMDEIIEKLHARGVRVTLATPTGAKPAWLAADAYPETLRTDATGRRQFWGFRHNHCPTSPVYREKSRLINTRLSNAAPTINSPGRDFPPHRDDGPVWRPVAAAQNDSSSIFSH